VRGEKSLSVGTKKSWEGLRKNHEESNRGKSLKEKFLRVKKKHPGEEAGEGKESNEGKIIGGVEREAKMVKGNGARQRLQEGSLRRGRKKPTSKPAKQVLSS